VVGSQLSQPLSANPIRSFADETKMVKTETETKAGIKKNQMKLLNLKDPFDVVG